jgi:hypothetical protein
MDADPKTFLSDGAPPAFHPASGSGFSQDGHGQRSFLMGRQLVWFSCGAASAVAAKLAIATHKGPEPLEILYCELANEHPDNARFRAECQEWFGQPIKGLRSAEYPTMDIYDVFRKEQYVAGIAGATCTKHLKREVRMAYEWMEDVHVFGYTVDEGKRIATFESENPHLRTLFILRDLGITKNDCYRIVADAGIELPMMYRLGYNNNNCICCVKGGAGYQNKCRVDFPEESRKMAEFTRAMGVKLVKYKGERIYLDELPPDAGNYEFEGDIECGPQCVTSQGWESDIQNTEIPDRPGSGQ